MNNRVDPPSRYRRARTTARLSTIQKEIEKIMGLPPKSVRLVHPSGRKAREDATVAALLRSWKNGDQ